MLNSHYAAAAHDAVHPTQQMKARCDALNLYRNLECSKQKQALASDGFYPDGSINV